MKLKHGILACATLWGACISSAGAYELRPMVIELSPSGSGSSASVTITNTHKVPIAIEISVHKREQNTDGSDKLSPEVEDLIVTPPQMIIPPGASQSVRVQWVGNGVPDHELPYRLVTQQLPIRLSQVTRDDKTADLTMKYRYEASLYIVPRGVEPSVRISSAEVVSSESGDKLRLTILSEGTKRAILDSPRLTLARSTGNLVLEGEGIAELQGMNILPGSTRIVDIAAPQGFSKGTVSAQIETRYMFAR